MSWQQQQQGNYDNYGGYVDPGYGQNDQQNQYYSGPSTGTVSVSKMEVVAGLGVINIGI